MSLRSSSQGPRIVAGAEPRGRPTMALIGLFVVIGGVIFSGLVAQGIIPLLGTGAPQPTTSTSQPTGNSGGPAPGGSRPSTFVTYHDPQQRFALYVSSTWQEHDTSMVISGQTTPATGFAPTGTTLPNWRLAFASASFPTTSVAYITAVEGILTAEGASNYIPNFGPQSITIGTLQWSKVGMDAQLKGGANAHVVAYAHTSAAGVVLIVEEALTLGGSFTTTDQQDYQPMLSSLVLKNP